MTPDDVRKTVKSFVRDRFMIGKPDDFTSDSDSLIEKGILDSTGVLELVGFLEETFEMKVEDEELIPENLESIDNIVGFLDRRSLKL